MTKKSKNDQKDDMEKLKELSLEQLEKLEKINRAGVPDFFLKNYDDAVAFRKTLAQESDRGCALMAASYLDDQLKILLESHLVEDKKISKELFEFNGALGTFSSRIEMSYMLGLLPSNVRKDLHIIRKARNHFAHSPSPMTFNDKELKEFCINLTMDGMPRLENPIAKFRRATMGILSIIQTTKIQCERIKPAPNYDIKQKRSDMMEILNKIVEHVK